ncbi:RraA family protein [Cereibacter sp. SYSU M97828]|nr:RraA family protein [Cereibacter flavus]
MPDTVQHRETSTAGLRIAANRTAVAADLIRRLAQVPVACISDSMFRMAAGGARLRPIGQARMVGPAITVKVPPGDNLMVHKALDMAMPGMVLVVDAGGDLTNAIIGERMVAVAAARQLAGIIINGAIRDAEALRNHTVPVFAAGVTHRGPYKNGPGEINFPVAIDGMVIESGDLIASDDDGFVCIPLRDAETVCALAEQKFRHENENDPVTGSKDWIEATLRRIGCEIPARTGG